MKFFNLELKDNDPMKLASEIIIFFHDIESTGVRVDLQLTTFIKALYHTYSHYLESLKASAKMKAMNFDIIVDKNVEREKDFRKKESLCNSTVETLCLAQKSRNLEESFLDLTTVKEVMVEDHLEVGGSYHHGDRQQDDR